MGLYIIISRPTYYDVKIHYQIRFNKTILVPKKIVHHCDWYVSVFCIKCGDSLRKQCITIKCIYNLVFLNFSYISSAAIGRLHTMSDCSACKWACKRRVEEVSNSANDCHNYTQQWSSPIRRVTMKYIRKWRLPL